MPRLCIRRPGLKRGTWGAEVKTSETTRTGVPRSRTCTTMVFMVFNLGILGDNLPINMHEL